MYASMKYYVVYEADAYVDVDIGEFEPPFLELWTETESHLSERNEELEVWKGLWGQHKKWCAELCEEEFAKLLDQNGLCWAGPTAGLIGYPSMGWNPAIAFIGDSQDNRGHCEAWVCPIPEIPQVDENQLCLFSNKTMLRLQKNGWKSVEAAIKKKFY